MVAAIERLSFFRELVGQENQKNQDLLARIEVRKGRMHLVVPVVYAWQHNRSRNTSFHASLDPQKEAK